MLWLAYTGGCCGRYQLYLWSSGIPILVEPYGTYHSNRYINHQQGPLTTETLGHTTPPLPTPHNVVTDPDGSVHYHFHTRQQFESLWEGRYFYLLNPSDSPSRRTKTMSTVHPLFGWSYYGIQEEATIWICYHHPASNNQQYTICIHTYLHLPMMSKWE